MVESDPSSRAEQNQAGRGGAPLLIRRPHQLALTSCGARWLFGKLVLVAINHRELAQECDSIPLAAAQPRSRRRADSRKRRVKSGEERGTTGLNAPPVSAFPLKRKRGRFSPPQSQKSFVTRASRHNGRAALQIFAQAEGENLRWIKPRRQSGPDFRAGEASHVPACPLRLPMLM